MNLSDVIRDAKHHSRLGRNWVEIDKDKFDWMISKIEEKYIKSKSLQHPINN